MKFPLYQAIFLIGVIVGGTITWDIRTPNSTETGAAIQQCVDILTQVQEKVSE